MNINIDQKSFSTGLKFLVITLLALGIFFRFVNLDQKLYWLDETFTSLHISGYSDLEVEQQIVNGRIVSVSDLQKYQHPNSEKNVGDTVKRIAETAPEVPPLYFIMARFWMRWFGNSVAGIRSLSACISLLVFPSVFWLCVELFRSPSVGWMAVALIAVSPFHLLYAQEARAYSLWTVIILLSNTLLLRGMRLKTRRSWSLYSLASILGLYTHLFHVFVFFAQGIYVLFIERFRLSKTLISYTTASLISLIAFLPWIVFTLITRLQKTEPKIDQAPAIYMKELVKGWVRNVSLFFADFGINENFQLIYIISFVIISLIILALVGVAIYFLCQKTEQKTRLFILISMAVPVLAIIFFDLIQGQLRSTSARYLIPSGLCIQLTVAYLLANRISPISVKSPKSDGWKMMAIALLSVGLLSCISIYQSPFWWNKLDDEKTYNMAVIINQAQKPLIVSDILFVKMLSLSYLLKNHVKIQLLPVPKAKNIPDGYSDVFLYDPSQELVEDLKKNTNIKVKAVYNDKLWLVEKN